MKQTNILLEQELKQEISHPVPASKSDCARADF